MDPLLCSAIATVRGWTRLYTWGMDRACRDRRREEIESDLWEFHEDARHQHHSPAGIAAHMLLRLAAGLPDDVLWRIESVDETARARRRMAWRTAGAAGITTCYAAAWVFFLIAYFVSLTPLPDSNRVEHTLIRRSAPPPAPRPSGMRLLLVGRSAPPLPPPPPPYR